jgi:transcription antitermination protein NusB
VTELGLARHRSRERALELLYEQTIKARPLDDVLRALDLTPDPYTVVLLRAVELDREWAEGLMSTHSPEWPLARMAMVDRLIMTLALCELRTTNAPPRAVVLNEAVELAKMYSTDASPSFINGVLAACVEEHEFGI